MLIINALAGGGAVLKHLSDSDDTRLLQGALADGSGVKDVGHAGTAMRFLAAYYATKPGTILLTGSERMRQRPMGPLIGALRQLGAIIECSELEGYPPLRITGGDLRGGEILIDGGISSQFISALLMIAPILGGGLQMTLTGRVVSETYIRMTLSLMQEAGIEAVFDGHTVSVPEKRYHLKGHTVESDWSAASYWYEIASLLPGSDITLPHLSGKSLQGDAVLTTLFAPLGVVSGATAEGISIRSGEVRGKGPFTADFLGAPDLVQTCVATCCARGIPFRFTGTGTLMVKETDRIAALQAELGKLGYELAAGKGGEFIAWDGTRKEPVRDPLIETYHDHRMAMALAPMAIVTGPLTIADPGVVTKSYPGFWEDLKKAGFSIQEA